MKTNTSKSGIARKIVISGVSGIALGASTMATAGNAIIEDIADGAAASGNYEDMSFGEAFAAARAEAGPDGTFEWHGNIYSTSTAQEWESSHPSEPLITEDNQDDIQEDEVEILDTEDSVEDDDIEVEIETGSDINGDEAAFVEIEDDIQTDAVEDVYVGEDTDFANDISDYSNDDASIV